MFRVLFTISIFKPPLATARAAQCIGAVHLFVSLFVCLSPKCKKTRFFQKLSNLELWCLLTNYRKSYMGFSKNPSRDPYNSRWRRSAILDLNAKMQNCDFLTFSIFTHHRTPKIQDGEDPPSLIVTPKSKNAIFSKTQQFRPMVSIDDLQEVVHGLFKKPIIGPLKPKSAEIRHLGS